MRAAWLVPLVFGCAHRLDRLLPVDPAVRTGVLPNGLTWYVEHNEQPQKRAVLHLVVHAGSVLEGDDERGLAHFVEHMAFNGTEHFPGQTLIETLESSGTRFGPHLNAHTGFDETIYDLVVPTDDPDALDRALLVLAEWAGGITFAEEEIEKEKGVVLEEWRTGLGAAGRIQEQTVPLAYAGSPYVERLPIGTKESIEAFTAVAARRFYRDWYRPDLMSVVAVGDFDAAEVEQLIARRLSGLKGPADPPPRPRHTVPDPTSPRFAVIDDPEVAGIGISILAPHDAVEESTARHYRGKLVETMALAIVNERLADLARRPDPPFLSAGAAEQRLTAVEGASQLAAAVDESGIERGYRALLEEILRVREHGFTEGEIARARARVLEGFERVLREKYHIDSATHAAEIVRVVTTGEAIPGTEVEVELARRFVPEIGAGELQVWATSWMPEQAQVVTLVLPRKPGLAPPTTERLAEIAEQVAASLVAPPDDDVEVGPLVAGLPVSAVITSRDSHLADELQFTALTLSNGIDVWFRDTDFQADEIHMIAFSPGGTSTVTDADLVPAATAIEILLGSGMGEHDARELQRWLAGRTASLELALHESWEVATGTSSAADVGALLEMVHAAFGSPRFTPDGLARTTERRAAVLRNRAADPLAHFVDAYDRLVWADDPRRVPWTLATLDQMSLSLSEAIYTERFGPAGDFTFVFVGSLPDDFEPLVATWLGSLPGPSTADASTDRGVRPARGALAETIHRGIDEQARVLLEWHGPFEDNSWETRSQLFALGDLLSVKLRDELREQRGGVYGVDVAATEVDRPAGWYHLTVTFGCDPDRVEELVAATRAIVESLRSDGPTEDDVHDLQEQNRREREVLLRDNGFWVAAFATALQRGADPRDLLGWDARNDSLSPAILRDAARAWLDPQDTVEIVLLPDEPPAASP